MINNCINNINYLVIQRIYKDNSILDIYQAIIFSNIKIL